MRLAVLIMLLLKDQSARLFASTESWKEGLGDTILSYETSHSSHPLIVTSSVMS